MKIFILRNDSNLERVITNLIVTLKDLDLTKAKEVKITDYKEDKSGEQRAWFHILCGLFGAEVGYTKLQMKRVMMKKVFGTETILGEEVSMSSEKLKRDEYSQLIEQTYIEAGEMGIPLPPPVRND